MLSNFLYVAESRLITLRNCTLIGNSALPMIKPAIFVALPELTDTLSIEDCIFRGFSNTFSIGLLIASQYGKVIISNSTFSELEAKDGGALGFVNRVYIRIIDTVFSINKATRTAGAIIA